MSITTTTKVHLALLSSVVVWSGSFVAIRIALTDFEPATIALLRFFVASITLTLFARNFTGINRLEKIDISRLLCIGLIGIVGYSLLLNSGEQTVSSGIASVIVAQTPVVTAFLAILMLKERPNIITIFGIVVSCFGISLIVTKQPMEVDWNAGLFMLATATVCGSLHSIFQKPLLKKFSPYVVTTLTTWIATGALLIFMPNALAQLGDASSKSIAAVFFLGVVPSAIGQLLWAYGLSKTLVVRASAYLYLMPMFSTFFGWLVLGENPGKGALLGGTIALMGAAIINRHAFIKPKTAPSRIA